MGLSSGYTYSVNAACEVKDSKGKNARILQVRSFWGSGEWKGDWS